MALRVPRFAHTGKCATTVLFVSIFADPAAVLSNLLGCLYVFNLRNVIYNAYECKKLRLETDVCYQQQQKQQTACVSFFNLINLKVKLTLVFDRILMFFRMRRRF